jgi:TonB family protein
MNAALLYRPRRRWLFWIAFGCAAAIHIGAVVVAKGRSDKIAVQDFRPTGDEVEISYAEPEQSPPEESVTPPEPVPPDEETFQEENRTPAPVRPHKKIQTASVLRGTTATFGSVKTLVMYAPRPIYPYEARRQRIIGSGIALLTVDPIAGNVTNVLMTRSCGNVNLDNSTLDTLRRWRFKPGSAERRSPDYLHPDGRLVLASKFYPCCSLMRQNRCEARE